MPITPKRKLIYSAFVLYVLALIFITILSRTSRDFYNYQFVPFYSYYKVLCYADSTYLCPEILLNIILFIPLGVISGILSWKLKTITLLGFLMTFFIELSQLIFRCGYCETDDLISNMIGCWLGYMLTNVIGKNHVW